MNDAEKLRRIKHIYDKWNASTAVDDSDLLDSFHELRKIGEILKPPKTNGAVRFKTDGTRANDITFVGCNSEDYEALVKYLARQIDELIQRLASIPKEYVWEGK